MDYFYVPKSGDPPSSPTNIPRYHVLFPMEPNIYIVSVIKDKMYNIFPKELVQYMKQVASFEGLPFIPNGNRITFLNKELLKELFTSEVIDKICKKFDDSQAIEFREQFIGLYKN